MNIYMYICIYCFNANIFCENLYVAHLNVVCMLRRQLFMVIMQSNLITISSHIFTSQECIDFLPQRFSKFM